MELLNDIELLKLVRGESGENPIVSGMKGLSSSPLPEDYHKDSPVQPSSIDLHTGYIYLPEIGTSNNVSGGINDPKKAHVLKPSEAAFVETLEELDLPDHLAAFGFPPSRVSIQGILMTNPGHVDPGYKGKMHFTVINMGREDFILNQGDPIVTLLIVKIQPCKADWSKRIGSGATSPDPKAISKTINRLSVDFLEVKKRAQIIVDDKAKEINDTLEKKLTEVDAKLATNSTQTAATISTLKAETTATVNSLKADTTATVSALKAETASTVNSLKAEATATVNAARNVSGALATIIPAVIGLIIGIYVNNQNISRDDKILKLQTDLAQTQNAVATDQLKKALMATTLSAIKQDLEQVKLGPKHDPTNSQVIEKLEKDLDQLKPNDDIMTMQSTLAAIKNDVQKLKASIH